jgi:hypothetical protein
MTSLNRHFGTGDHNTICRDGPIWAEFGLKYEMLRLGGTGLTKESKKAEVNLPSSISDCSK